MSRLIPAPAPALAAVLLGAALALAPSSTTAAPTIAAPTTTAPTTAAAPAERAAPVVRFTKAYFDSPGSDNQTNSSLNAEWVRVTNFSSVGKTLTGWTIRDVTGHVYRFPTFTLRAGASVRLHTGRGTNSRTDLYWRQDNYVWNNSGDTAILKNRAGTRIDTCAWSGAGDWVNC